MLDRMTGQSRGFCFVEMATQEGAEKALNELNGQDFEGRALRVDVAQERPRGGGGGGGGGGFRGGGGGRGGDRGGRGGRY
jgi:RNA recognition motif-containing protein